LNFKISIIKKLGGAYNGSNTDHAQVTKKECVYGAVSNNNSDDTEIYDDDSDKIDYKNKKVVIDYGDNNYDDGDVDDDDDGGNYESSYDDENYNFNEEVQTEGVDDTVVRMIFQSVNSIIKFMTLNCNFPSFSHNDDESTSYLSIKSNKNPYGITKFLDDIRELQLESLKICSLNEMLLLDKNEWNWIGVELKIKERNVQFVKIV